MERYLDITKPRYSELILPVPFPVLVSGLKTSSCVDRVKNIRQGYAIRFIKRILKTLPFQTGYLHFGLKVTLEPILTTKNEYIMRKTAITKNQRKFNI